MVEALGRPSGLDEVSQGGDCQKSQSTDYYNNDANNGNDNDNDNDNSYINLKVEVVRCLRLQMVKW